LVWLMSLGVVGGLFRFVSKHGGNVAKAGIRFIF
jgi:hypothetical protein